MKKLFSFLFMLIIVVGLVSCGNKASISTNIKSINIYENETFDLTDGVFEVSNSDSEIVYTVLDEEIAEIKDGCVYPKKAGATKIRATIKKNKYCEIALIVFEGMVASNISITHENIVLNLVTRKTAINKITVSEESTEVPNISYNSNIIDYNFESGLITAKAVGQTKVAVSFARETIYFDVKVEGVVYATSVQINDVEVKTGSQGVFNIIKVPSDCNSYALWTESDLIEVTPDGFYNAIAEGEATVKYNYLKGEGHSSGTFSFKVKISSGIPDVEMKITRENFMETEKCLIDETYKFVINLPEDYSTSRFMPSEEIELIGLVEYDKYRGFVGTFKFKKLGLQRVGVVYQQDLNDESKNLVFIKLVEVVKGEHYSVKAKYSSSVIDVDNDNCFVMNINDPIWGSKKEMIFSLYLEDMEVYDEYQIYYINGDKKLLENKAFIIESVGTYNFEIKLDDKVVVNFSVQVIE